MMAHDPGDDCMTCGGVTGGHLPLADGAVCPHEVRERLTVVRCQDDPGFEPRDFPKPRHERMGARCAGCGSRLVSGEDGSVKTCLRWPDCVPPAA